MSFSVLLSIYAKEKPQYLNESLCSIWDQQTLKPGQIVLVKDGPLTEELDDCINNWKKKLGELLTVVALPENVGLGAALNSGLEHCRYELVARMDTDDVSLPNRFEKQIAFMENNPDIAASSAVLEEWDENFSKYFCVRTLPLEPEEIKKFAKYRCPLSHAVTIYRKSIVLSVGGYPVYRVSEDYNLWALLLTKGYKLSNLPDILYKQRAGKGLMKRRSFRQFRNELKALKYQRTIAFLNGYEYLRNIIIRFLIRVPPGFIKSFFYKYRHIRKYQFFIALVDIALLVLAVFLSICLRFLDFPSIGTFIRLIPHFGPIIIVWLVSFSIAGFYSLEIPRMGYKLLSHLSIIAVVCTTLSFAYFYLNIEFQRGPRTILLIYGFIAVVLTALWRLILNRIAKKYIANINIAFMGSNATVVELLQNMQDPSRRAYKVASVLDDSASRPVEYFSVPVIKDTKIFIETIKRYKVKIIIFTSENTQPIHDVLFELIPYHIEFISVNDFYELFMRRIPGDTLNELGFLRNISFQSKKIYCLAKRTIDVVMALVVFIISLPFWPFIVLAIKLDSPGTAFIKMESIGYLGRPFTVVKFRATESSRVGKFLRGTRIDETPQFLNVLKAEMSFIGPRPECPELIQNLEREVPFYRQRLLVKPGLSGWDQVSGEYHSPSQEDTYKKLQYDLYYIKNMSLFLDISIFLKTLVTIVRRGWV